MQLRNATIADAEFLFRLRTDPTSQKMFFGKPPASLTDHKKWLAGKLADPGFFLAILEEGGDPVAYFRVDADGDTSVAVAPEARGRGYAAEVIRRGVGEHLASRDFSRPYIAVILADNPASKQAFLRAGFQEAGREHHEGKTVDRLELRPKVQLLAASKGWEPEQVAALSRATLNKFVVVREKEELTPELIRRVAPEYAFFPHWSHLLPAGIYEVVPCVMFHMTDLPFGRGGSPLQNLISRGHKTTKLSCFLCDGGMDTGPVFFKRELGLEGSARQIFARVEQLIVTMIADFLAERPQAKPQEGEPVVFKRRKPEESDIFSLANIEKIFDHIRMLDADGYPPAYIEHDGIRFEFSDAKLDNGEVEAKVRIRKL